MGLDLIGTGATKDDKDIPGEVGFPIPEPGLVEVEENVGDPGDSGVRGCLNPPRSTFTLAFVASVLFVRVVSKLGVSFESDRELIVGGGLLVGGIPDMELIRDAPSGTGFNDARCGSSCDWLCSDTENDIEFCRPLLVDWPESGISLDIERLIIIDSGTWCSLGIERLCDCAKSASVSRVMLCSVMGESPRPTVRSGGNLESKLILGSSVDWPGWPFCDCGLGSIMFCDCCLGGEAASAPIDKDGKVGSPGACGFRRRMRSWRMSRRRERMAEVRSSRGSIHSTSSRSRKRCYHLEN